MSEVPGSLSEFDPEINIDFEENSPFQEGMISEMYQKPDKSYFQEPQEMDSLINTGRLVQMFLLKQTDIDKILKIIQRKVIKGMHLPVNNMLRFLQKNITYNRIMGLQNIPNPENLIHTLMHHNLAITLMDTPGYIFYLYIFLPLLLSLLRTLSILV